MQEPQTKSDYKYQDIDKVNYYLSKGILRGRENGDMICCSYNEISMKKDKIEWDETLLSCRGIRLKKDDGLVVNPCMRKGFNLGERPETKLDALPNEPFTVTEKLDGTMLTMGYGWDGEFHITTKASWDNDYTRFGRQVLPTMDEEDRWVTLVGEIFIPNDPMRRVTERQKGIHLITAFNSFTCEELSRSHVEYYAEKYGLFIVPQVHGKSIQELAALMDTVKGTEGWVVRFDSGARVKVKSVWYRAINWFLEDINDPEKARATIKEYLIGNNGSLDWISSWPEELQEEVGAIANSIIMDYLLAKKAIEGRCKVHKDLSHKDFAIKFKEDPLFHHMMSYRRGHDNWKERLWKVV